MLLWGVVDALTHVLVLAEDGAKEDAVHSVTPPAKVMLHEQIPQIQAVTTEEAIVVVVVVAELVAQVVLVGVQPDVLPNALQIVLVVA